MLRQPPAAAQIRWSFSLVTIVTRFSYARDMDEGEVVRLVVAAADAAARAELRAFVDAHPAIRIVAAAGGSDEAAAAAADESADAVLLDIALSEAADFRATAAIRDASPATEVLSLLDSLDPQLLARALAAGAIGYVLKSMTEEEIAAMVRAAASEAVVLPRGLPAATVEATVVPVDPPDLTPRELELLRLAAAGMSLRAIADEQGYAYGTVKNRLSEIYERLGATGLAHAVAIAHKLSLVD